jgi:hypothetical protein
MKKVFSWYNQLLEKEMLEFSEEEAEVEEKAEKKTDADKTDKKDS